MFSRTLNNVFWRGLGLIALLAAAGCGSSQGEYAERAGAPAPYDSSQLEEEDSGFLGLGGGSDAGVDETGAKIGVNGYLWRASLDTLAFMPLQSVDPFGGVIITDWYAAPQAPEERFKMNVYILDRRLRADGVKVAVFRQERRASQWVDAVVNPDTAIRLENAILKRARELRIDTAQ